MQVNPKQKKKIIDMAMNGSGTRNIGRVLKLIKEYHVSNGQLTDCEKMPMSVYLFSIVYVKLLIAIWKILPSIKRVNLVFVTRLTLLYFQITAALEKSLQSCVKYWITTALSMTRKNCDEMLIIRYEYLLIRLTLCIYFVKPLFQILRYFHYLF